MAIAVLFKAKGHIVIMLSHRIIYLKKQLWILSNPGFHSTKINCNYLTTICLKRVIITEELADILEWHYLNVQKEMWQRCTGITYTAHHTHLHTSDLQLTSLTSTLKLFYKNGSSSDVVYVIYVYSKCLHVIVVLKTLFAQSNELMKVESTFLTLS